MPKVEASGHPGYPLPLSDTVVKLHYFLYTDWPSIHTKPANLFILLMGPNIFIVIFVVTHELVSSCVDVLRYYVVPLMTALIWENCKQTFFCLHLSLQRFPPDVRDSANTTPLHLAAKYAHW